jgi:hypothetical protein
LGVPALRTLFGFGLPNVATLGLALAIGVGVLPLLWGLRRLTRRWETPA